MKKTLALLLALVTLLSVCSLTALAEETLEPVTIKMAIWDIPVLCESSDDFTKEDGKYYDARWAYMAEKFNVRFEYVPLEYNTHQEKLRIMINGDDMPDVMISTLGISEYMGYCEDEMLTLLPEGYEENYPHIKAALELIKQRDAYKYDGQYYAVPRALESAEPYVDYNSSFYYRKDLAKAAGVEIKDYYTVDEVYDMYEKVQAANPDMTMFGHIWPDNIQQLGLVEYVPELSTGGFYYNADQGKYVWAWADESMADGIRAMKKFYDAGFLSKEFYNDPFYEARNQFWNGTLFSYFDGFDFLFFNQAMSGFLTNDPTADAESMIGYAYLLDKDGNMQAKESGNSWSEYIFRHDCDEKVIDRFLAMYDYLLSDEGIMLCYYGIEDKDWKWGEDGAIVSLRTIDEATGKPVPFNKDGEAVSDLVHPFFPGAMEDSKIANLSDKYSPFVKETVNHFWTLRKEFPKLKVLAYDNDLALFNGDFYSKSGTLKPMEAVYKIVYEQTPETVGDAWQQYLNENAGMVQNILDELNAGIQK